MEYMPVMHVLNKNKNIFPESACTDQKPSLTLLTRIWRENPFPVSYKTSDNTDIQKTFQPLFYYFKSI